MISVAILVPLFVGITLLVLREPAKGSRFVQRNPVIAIVATLLTFASAIVLQKQFAAGYGEAQLREVWLTVGSGINLSFALDGISMPLFLVTAFLFLVAALFSYNVHRLSAAPLGKIFWGNLLVLEATVLGVFAAWNFVVFFMFWELFLIPITVLIWRYGLDERKKAALNFFIYTFVSSAFMLAAFAAVVFYIPRIGGDFDLRTTFAPEIQSITGEKQRILFLFFATAFLVKMPIIPFHAWLPLTHTQAPLGSLLLSGLFLKLGSYGLLRFVTPNFTGVIAEWGQVFMYLGLASMFYGAFAAYRQKSFRNVIAYSSLAHMGLMLSAVFAQHEYAITGVIIQNVGHSLANALLFVVVVMHLARNKSDELGTMSAPPSTFYWITLSIALFSAIGVPGTVGFVGEFLMLLGISYRSWLLAGFAVFTLVFSAAYMLRLFHKVRAQVADQGWRPTTLERVCMGLLVVAILWFGILPGFVGENARSAAKTLSTVGPGVRR
ncbi:MAG: NADH-quinone oxidoreductase subunit M [Turneriella sp.]